LPDPPDHIAFDRIGSGPPMILIHGCPATRTLWRPLVEPLSRHRTLYIIDLPGFGATPAPDEPSDLALGNIAETITVFASLQRLERFDLVGHSFGGAIAASIAEAHPERVTSLVMIAPMGSDIPTPARAARTAFVRSVVAGLWRYVPHALRRTIVRMGSRANYGPAYSRERATEIARELDRDDAIDAICALVGAVDYDDYRARIERLAALDTAILLVGAGRDRVVPFRHFRALRELLAGADTQIFHDGVHVVMWQYPDDVAGRILGFIERRG
jgi:pimeloyl-ACP methyl ester carboxylesterase